MNHHRTDHYELQATVCDNNLGGKHNIVIQNDADCSNVYMHLPSLLSCPFSSLTSALSTTLKHSRSIQSYCRSEFNYDATARVNYKYITV